MSRRRWRDAVVIQTGACNPLAIANSIVSACRECGEEGVTPTTDAAVRAMVHQLAFICGERAFDNQYSELMDECRAKVAAEAQP